MLQGQSEQHPFRVRIIEGGSFALKIWEDKEASGSVDQVTGILCEKTGLWHLVANDSTLPLLSDPSMRGQQVVVEGQFLDDIRAEPVLTQRGA